MPSALDLTGQTFGYLKAIKKAPSKNGRTYWTCECQLCGSIKDYQTLRLRNGSNTSCGCRSRYDNFKLQTEEEKVCPICGKVFVSKMKNRLYCYECSPEQSKVGSQEYQKQKQRAIKHKLVEYKGGKCQKCGYDKCEGALQFHHRDPEEKDFTLSHINLSKNFSMEALLKEVDKCDLLCANCHAEIHYQDSE